MSRSSDVRDIDALERLRAALDELSHRLGADGETLRASVRHAQSYFAEDAPRYWRDQVRIAERELTQADQRLRNKRSAARPGDAAPATEEQKQVNRWHARLRLANDKLRACRPAAVRIDQAADKCMGPIIQLIELAGTSLPASVSELTQILDQLGKYRDP
ncbi:MAG: hypothetical protein AAF670_16805 [Planctomycetota bacterium]